MRNTQLSEIETQLELDTWLTQHITAISPIIPPKRLLFRATPTPGFLALVWRIFDAIVESRQKSANREIALRLARSGGRITDSIERDITQSLLKGNWKVRD